jgi:type 1 fimbria pilin
LRKVKILVVTLVATLLVASPAFAAPAVNGGGFNITIGGIIQE